MSKNKPKQKRAQKRREERRARRNRTRPGGEPRRSLFELPAGGWEPEPEAIFFDPPGLDRCGPPIYIDATGCRVPDPYATLGLDASQSSLPSVEEVRAACRQRLLEHPPEQNPETARALVAARDRLIDPERVIEREVGVLHVPGPEVWGLPAVSAIGDRGARRLDALGRLMGQLVLYALVEDELRGPVGGESGGPDAGESSAGTTRRGPGAAAPARQRPQPRARPAEPRPGPAPAAPAPAAPAGTGVADGKSKKRDREQLRPRRRQVELWDSNDP